MNCPKHGLPYEAIGIPGFQACPDCTEAVPIKRVRSEVKPVGSKSTPTEKKPKYRNTRCEYEGLKFDSEWERDRWICLVDMQKKGEITDLQRQVVFCLVESVRLGGRKKPNITYVADFVYVKDGVKVVADAKGGALLPTFRMKQHLMKSVHGIEVQIVRRNGK